MAKEISSYNPKINNLIRQIESGEVKIPPLQRPFVWKVDQIIDLLESIYNDYPIGSVLWWETNESLPSERNIAGFKLPRRPDTHPFYYVLDGQQRLSSLYGVFCTDRTKDESTDDYKINIAIFDIIFDLKEKRFVHANNDHSEKFFELKNLFDTSLYSDSLIKASEEEREIIQDLYNKFTNYEIPIIITKKRKLEEVGMIFERVNNTGTKLDLFDLMVALTWTKNFHLQNEFKIIHNILKDKNFNGIKNKVILQCISSIIKESSRLSVITSLSGGEIRENISVLLESLKRTVDYLSTELSVRSVKLLPHAHQIVPLCYFFSRVKTPSINQKKQIDKWFWKTSFSNRFTESTDSHIDEDIVEFKKLVSDEKKIVFEKIKYTATKEQLKETKFLQSSFFSRAFVVLLANKVPLDLTNGLKIDTGEALSSFNKKEYHHVFPKNYLVSNGVKEEKANSLCNFCLLPANSNKLISDKAPSNYFINLIPVDKYSDILESNMLPLSKNIYQDDDYSVFLENRATKIIEYLETKII